LRRFRGLDGAKIADPLRHASAIANLVVSVAGIVLNAECRHANILVTAIYRAQANQEEAVLRHPRFGPIADVRHPLRLEHQVNDVAELNTLAHVIGADRVFPLLAPARDTEERSGKRGRKPKPKE